jgi:hypothetical protein
MVIVKRDLNEIRIFEGLRGAFEGCVVECSSGGGKPPDQAVEVLGVLRIASFAALGGEIEEVPPREFCARRQRVGDRGLATDQIAAHRDQGFAALRPEKRHQVRSSAAPVESRNDDLLD